jgi:hypothetical protein
MSINKIMPAVYFVFGIVSAIIAYTFSLEWKTGQPVFSGEHAVGAGVDIAADGGALGFAILASICFACCAYLLKSKEKP